MTMAGQSEPLIPTFEGHIASTLDALVLFEACLSGTLSHVPRRPHDRERQELIKSGNVFIYEEHSSGIKRWTDGVSWSPSRILGNFLIYRELEKPFPPGEKKRALKKNKKCQQGISKPEPSPRSNSMGYPSAMDTGTGGKDAERSLIGSLIDSYPFKSDGLVKKTISVSYNGIPHHLVSYYNVNDVMAGRLQTPTKHTGLKHIMPRADLYMSQNFRAPLDEVEYNPDDRGAPGLFASLAGAHEFAAHGGSLQRAMSLPSFQPIQMPSYANSTPYSFSHQPQPSPFMNSVSTSAPPLSAAASMSYTAPSQGNYALDPTRPPRFASSAGLGHEFPRNMPNDHSPQRRHSTFEAAVPSELASISLGAIPEGRPVPNSNSYLSAPTYYLPHRSAPMPGHDQTFPSPRQMKAEPDLGGDDTTSQSYGLDENSAAWGFESLDGTGDHQYFGNHTTGSSQSWTGSNSLGRT